MATKIAHDLIREFNRRSLIIALIMSLVLMVSVPLVIYYLDVQRYKRESVALLRDFIDRELHFDVSNLLDRPAGYGYLFKKIDNFMDFGSFVDFKIWRDDLTNIYAFSDMSPEGDSMRLEGRQVISNEHLRKTIETRKVFAEIEHVGRGENASLAKYGRLLEVYVPIVVNGEVVGALEVYRKLPKVEFIGAHTVFIAGLSVFMLMLMYLLLFGQFKRASREIIAYDARLSDAYAGLGRTYVYTVMSLARALELRDMETEGHSERVVALSVYIGRKMNLDDNTMCRLIMGAYLHDIGKIGIPDSILLKPGELTPEERRIMQTHVVKGFNTINNVGFLEAATDVVLGHHEWFNGGGYPSGIKANNIPIGARIFAVVDVFDALVSKRPYKEAFAVAEAKRIIARESGGHFDPAVVEVMNNMSEETIKGVIEKGAKENVETAIDMILSFHKYQA